MPLTTANLSIAPEVGEFCAAHDLSAALDHAIDQLSRAFPGAEKIVVSVEQDPDSHHRWILVDVQIAGSAAVVHPVFTESALHLGLSLSWPACTLIHPSYTIIAKP